MARRVEKRVAPPARDLAAQAQAHADLRATFVKHTLTRLPLIGVLVVTINLFVQVRGDVGLAVAVAQNLTFGGLLVVVLLNLAVLIILGVMVAAMPLVFDSDYNPWTRVVGAAVIVLLGAVLFHTASWVLLAGLAVVFIGIGIVVWRMRRRAPAPLTEETVRAQVLSDAAPADTELRTLWAAGRAALRDGEQVAEESASPGEPAAFAPKETPTEAEMHPRPDPVPLAAVTERWNERITAIREPRAKSVTRLAFAGIIGFIALFGLNILTQPIRFAPLELVALDNGPAEPGFVLLQGSNGVFIPDPFGVTRFITASDITTRELCEDDPQWWTQSPLDLLSPAPTSGVSCSVD